MFLNTGFDIVKRAGSLVFLLALSMSVQAGTQDTDTTAKEVADEASASAGEQRTFSFPEWSDDRPPLPERRPRLNDETFAGEGEQRTFSFPEWSDDRPPFPERRPRLNDETFAGEDQQRTFSFPRWPESRQINRERVPLAPPGPYMSSALNDFSSRGSSFDRDRNRHAIKTDAPDMSMKKFSPDIPWPSHAKSPARWQPENGNRYVEPRVKNMPYQLMPYNSSSNYNYGYKRGPAMNWPDSGSARSNPVMNNPAH